MAQRTNRGYKPLTGCEDGTEQVELCVPATNDLSGDVEPASFKIFHHSSSRLTRRLGRAICSSDSSKFSMTNYGMITIPVNNSAAETDSDL